MKQKPSFMNEVEKLYILSNIIIPMGEEKKGEQNKKGDDGWRRITSSLVIAVAVAFIIGVVLYPLHIVNLDLITIFGGASWIVTSLLIGLIVGAAHYLAPSNSKSTYVIVCLVLIFIGLLTMGALQMGILQGPADTVGGWFKTAFGGIGDAFACLDPTSEKCVSNPGNGGNPGGSTDVASVDFSGNKIIGDAIKTKVTISYDNKEDTIARVTPKCLVGETEETMQEISITSMGQPNDGSDFIFPKNKVTRTSLMCYGTVPPCTQGTGSACNQYVFFTLTRDVEITGDSWTMYINQDKDPVLSANTEQPYHVEIEALNNIFPQGQPSQIQVKIVGKDSKEKLKAVSHVTLTFPSEISIDCPDFNSITSGIELRNKDQSWFDQRFGSNEYAFDCTLTVNTETTTPQQIPVALKSDYTVESQFGPYSLTGATPQQ